MNYEQKGPEYFANMRADIIEFMDLKEKNLSVLEIGAGFGETLYYLKNNGFAKG